jgi:hypothetical protein
MDKAMSTARTASQAAAQDKTSARRFNIIHAMEAEALFRRWYDGASWSGWKAILRAAYALKMSDQDKEFFRTVAGDRDPPAQRCKELWVAAGRRSGKDSIASLCAAFAAATFDQGHLLRPGERALILCVATDRSQATICLNYCRSLFSATPMLAAMIQRETAVGFQLNNRCDIVIATASYRAVRGRAIALVVLDEVAFYQSESSASPDLEIYRALLPGLASLPGSMLIAISSPYKKGGILYSKFKSDYGKDNASVLFIRSDTRTLNPLIDQTVIDEAFADDPVAARAEWGGFFRDDVGNWLSAEIVEAAVDQNVVVRAPVLNKKIKYHGAADPGGGSGQDSFTASVAHLAANGDVVQDALLEIRPPYSPTAAVDQAAALFKNYALNSCTGDAYSALWCVESFAKVGVRYEHSERNRSEIYLDCLPLFTAGRARILDNKRLINQFQSLERKTSSVGRDRVNHPIGQHDDCANATALAMVLAEAPIYAPPQACFGTYSRSFPSNEFGYCGPGPQSAGEIFASMPAEEWAKVGVFHPSDRQKWIDRGVYKPREEKTS